MKSLLNIVQEKLYHQQVDEKLVITKDTKENVIIVALYKKQHNMVQLLIY